MTLFLLRMRTPRQLLSPRAGCPAGPGLLTERPHPREPTAHCRLRCHRARRRLRLQPDRVQRQPRRARAAARSTWSPRRRTATSPRPRPPRATWCSRSRTPVTEVTEFYFYAADGLRIVGEIENVGPGLSRDLVVRAAAGQVRRRLQAGDDRARASARTSRSPTPARAPRSRASTRPRSTPPPASTPPTSRTRRSSWSTETTKFTDAYKAGDDEKARELFPQARGYWERIETVAESFGDLDPKMDLREADLEEGQKWTGWHRIEKDLWPPASGYKAHDPGRAGDVRRRPAGQHQGPRPARADAGVHRRPDRQRLQGPARRGRERQDHRRGGHLVAHRPLRLPGQRRRRPGRLRGPQAAARGQGPRARQADRDRVRPTCSRCSTSTSRARTTSSPTTRSPTPSARSSPTRSTRSPSRCRR